MTRKTLLKSHFVPMKIGKSEKKTHNADFKMETYPEGNEGAEGGGGGGGRDRERDGVERESDR
jgi:hypothetical protein